MNTVLLSENPIIYHRKYSAGASAALHEHSLSATSTRPRRTTRTKIRIKEFLISCLAKLLNYLEIIERIWKILNFFWKIGKFVFFLGKLESF